MSPNKLLDTPFTDIRNAIQKYISPKEKEVMAEWAKFFSVTHGGESDQDLLRAKRKTVTNP